MRARTLGAGPLRDERGSVLVLVTFLMPLLLFLVTLAVDVGDWYAHKRHLQTQADAAAFAGAGDFQDCFSTGGAGYAGIMAAATAYAGARGDYWGESFGASAPANPPPAGEPDNRQLGGTAWSNVMALFQSPTYWERSTVVDPDLTSKTSPCESPYILDVKATEHNLPLYLPYLDDVLPPVDAHARVQLRAISAANPAMPLAVPDVNPQAVGVTFVDERTQTELTGCSAGSPLAKPIAGTSCSFALAKGATAGGGTQWSGVAGVRVPAGSSNIGVRIGIGGGLGSCAGVGGGANYVCYAAPDGWQGLVMIRGYDPSTAGSTAAPQLRSAWPTTACAISPFFSAAALGGAPSCAAGLSAVVDFGAGANKALEGLIASVGSKKVAMTLGADGVWRTAANAFSIPAGTGANDVMLSWSYDKGKGSFNGGKAIQRIFSGSDDASGPIEALALSDYSLTTGNHDVTVSVVLQGNLEVADACDNGTSGAAYDCATDRPVLLRFASASGSENYAVNCGLVPDHTGGGFYQELRYGCANSYSINEAGVCPDPAGPSPPSCVPIGNFVGDMVGQLRQAMNDRFAPGGVCTPNAYPSVESGDPRAVTLIVTNFDAFTESGGSGPGVPVVTYAAFYVTGWDGAVPGCSGVNESPPAGKSKGDIWGHFVKYVVLGGDVSDDVCRPDVNPCTPVMTR